MPITPDILKKTIGMGLEFQLALKTALGEINTSIQDGLDVSGYTANSSEDTARADFAVKVEGTQPDVDSDFKREAAQFMKLAGATLLRWDTAADIVLAAEQETELASLDLIEEDFFNEGLNYINYSAQDSLYEMYALLYPSLAAI